MNDDTNNNGKPSDKIYLDPYTLPEDHPADAETRNSLYVRRGIESVIHSASPAASDDWVSAQRGETMIKEVTDAISKKQARLEATTGGFDPQTGKPVYVVAGRDRTNLEKELLQLQNVTLPGTKVQAADVEARRAQLPTVEQRLVQQGERRDRIAARGLELAEEAEAAAIAQRLLAARNKG